jgi:hypothetical protein
MSEGGYGMIYTVKNKDVVIKKGKYYGLIPEIDIGTRLNHPYIVKPIAYSFSYEDFYIAYPKGILISDYLETNKKEFKRLCFEFFI